MLSLDINPESMRSTPSRFKFSFLAIMLCFSVYESATAAPTDRCDSIIRKGIEAMQRNENVTSLKMLTLARNMARKNNWPKQEFLAVNNIGANYYSLLEYGLALNYYLEAYTIALKKLGPKFEMVVLNNIAILYSKEKKYDKANEYFQKSYAIAKENKDKLKMGLYAMNMGNVANEMENPTLGRKYFEQSISLLANEPKIKLLAQIGLADCDLAQGKWESARKSAQQMYSSANDLEFNDVGISLLTIIAKSYLNQNKLEEAEKYTNKLSLLHPNLETRISIYDMLSELHFKAKNYQKAMQYKDSVLKASSEFEAVKNGKLFETNKAKFEIRNYQNELVLKEAKLTSERRFFYAAFAIVIFIVIFIIWALRNRSVKHKQNKLIAERNEKILFLELEKEKNEHLLLEKQLEEKETIALLEQERLKNELESRNRKLSAKALYLSGRNEMIEEVLSKLSGVTQLANDITLSSQIKTLKDHLKTDAEWDDFITHFEQVNHTFLTTLKTKHPDLNANDVRFLSYIYMNLSNKEIASMLNITAEACRKRKERLLSKMELPESSSLYDYLATL
jgi:tetratricopeptide (TPR) repeat protein